MAICGTFMKNASGGIIVIGNHKDTNYCSEKKVLQFLCSSKKKCGKSTNLQCKVDDPIDNLSPIEKIDRRPIADHQVVDRQPKIERLDRQSVRKNSGLKKEVCGCTCLPIKIHHLK